MATAPTQKPKRVFSLAERRKRSERALKHYYANKKPYQGFDPQLTKGVALAPIPPPTAEQARLLSELKCLKRELATTQRRIAYLEAQLGYQPTA
jgi:hypothetical protein